MKDGRDQEDGLCGREREKHFRVLDRMRSDCSIGQVSDMILVVDVEVRESKSGSEVQEGGFEAHEDSSSVDADVVGRGGTGCELHRRSLGENKVQGRGRVRQKYRSQCRGRERAIQHKHWRDVDEKGCLQFPNNHSSARQQNEDDVADREPRNPADLQVAHLLDG